MHRQTARRNVIRRVTARAERNPHNVTRSPAPPLPQVHPRARRHQPPAAAAAAGRRLGRGRRPRPAARRRVARPRAAPADSELRSVIAREGGSGDTERLRKAVVQVAQSQSADCSIAPRRRLLIPRPRHSSPHLRPQVSDSDSPPPPCPTRDSESECSGQSRCH